MSCFSAADILLPDFHKVDGEKWACIACDQFTSEAKYWEDLDAFVGDAPSALRIILPEYYLGEGDDARIAAIHRTMKNYEKDLLVCHKDAMIYLERTQPDGRVRRGLIGKIDLETYDYRRDAHSLVRATEATVLSRIPPRVRIREGARLEAPHVMLLVDDPADRLISPLAAGKAEMAPAYSFPLAAGGGSVEGRFLTEAQKKAVLAALDRLAGNGDDPFLFAVGDGNHSLASAKAYYDALKEKLGDAAKDHPARYALVEVVNIHDAALTFEPIYRILFGLDPDVFLTDFAAYAAENPGALEITVVSTKNGKTEEHLFRLSDRVHPLPVGVLQKYLDEYLASHPEAKIDYIHDESSLRALAGKEGAIGFLFAGMSKAELFPAVRAGGSLPRKTFSMGVSRDKRYYIEARALEK